MPRRRCDGARCLCRPRRVNRVSKATAPDGTLTYLMHHGPADLLPVRGRDIGAALDRARVTGQPSARVDARAFRFQKSEEDWTSITLDDADARRWAAAVDHVIGLQTSYGVSVCLRLLALVELLLRVPWARRFVAPGPHGLDVAPVLLKLAAEAQLADDGRFDEAGFHAQLHSSPAHDSQHHGA